MRSPKSFAAKQKDLLRSLFSVVCACAVMSSALFVYGALMKKGDGANDAFPASLYASIPVGIAYEQRRELLAKFIFALAPNEPYVCQVAIGATVLNRESDARYPADIASVIFGFSPHFKEEFVLSEPSERTLRAARDALLGVDPSGGALYFCRKGNESDLPRPPYTVTANYGNYRFAK